MLLSASIGVAVNSLWLYNYDFEKYGVSRTTGLAEVELENVAAELISYFNSGEENIRLTAIKDGKPFELFNEREVIHLRDVKGLIWLGYRLLVGTLLYILSYTAVRLFWRRERRQLALSVVYGSGVTLALVLVLGLGALLDFDRFFLQFHLISFANDLWMLDPTRDYLIMLFPSGFWYDATLFCALTTVGMALVLGAVGAVYLKKRKVLSEKGQINGIR
jgi:integral membrane protein (TIGR01906 family)